MRFEGYEVYTSNSIPTRKPHNPKTLNLTTLKTS